MTALLVVTGCIVLALVELGLAVYLLVRARWTELVGLVCGALLGGVGAWFAARLWLVPMVEQVATAPGPMDTGRGFAVWGAAIFAGFVALAAALVASLLLGVVGLVIGDRVARLRVQSRLSAGQAATQQSA